jgi:hypothetical protein
MNFEMRPGPAKGLVEDAIADAEGRGLIGHVRAGDPAAWGAHADAARDWMGWLRAPEAMRPHIADIDSLVAACHQEGIRHALILGMGGSSLSPEVTRRTFGHGDGIELRVLDSTDPVAVARITDGNRLEQERYHGRAAGIRRACGSVHQGRPG